MKAICENLKKEYTALDEIVADLKREAWGAATPFYHWTIYDEIAHIAFIDSKALLAITDKVAFKEHVKAFFAQLEVDDRFTVLTNKMMGVMEPRDLLSFWRDTRGALVDALSQMSPKDRLPWYGPDMSALSFATARQMETWTHGQDVFDQLRIKRTNTDRLKNIAHLGVTTFRWSFKVHGRPVPEVPVYVALKAPSGSTWAWGDQTSEHQLTGSAEDFCLVVTQRRHLDDTELKVGSELMHEWLSIAQCFAGGPAFGPKPGVRQVVY